MASKPRTEQRQLPLILFDPLPSMEREFPGFLDVENQIPNVINKMIRNSGKDRYSIAAEMSKYMDREVTHHMLNAFTAAKEGNRFPLSFLPSFSHACAGYELLQYVANKMGCAILIGPEAEAANLGWIQLLEQELARERAKVQHRIDQARRLREIGAEQ
ncbi:hypothetical protein [Candidatus Magnetaquicoccus inordinatus]|uniref:hypothetical protein n=1 Tax=Candidatus Magnetaquicoccus inordinatus TaxID=2496818 RepID=UPI00102AD7E9|nr:hypothetical protein [Candidatus Magnetaquicoccus inordinatus]